MQDALFLIYHRTLLATIMYTVMGIMKNYLVISNFQPFYDVVETCYGYPCASEHLTCVFLKPWYAF